MDRDGFGAKGNFGTRWPGADTGHPIDLLGEDQFIEIQRAVGVGVLKAGSQGEGAADVEIVGVLQGHLGVLEGFASDLIGEDMQADSPGQCIKMLVKSGAVGHKGGVQGRPLVAEIEGEAGIKGVPGQGWVQVEGVGIELRKYHILSGCGCTKQTKDTAEQGSAQAFGDPTGRDKSRKTVQHFGGWGVNFKRIRVKTKKTKGKPSD